MMIPWSGGTLSSAWRPYETDASVICACVSHPQTAEPSAAFALSTQLNTKISQKILAQADELSDQTRQAVPVYDH